MLIMLLAGCTAGAVTDEPLTPTEERQATVEVSIDTPTLEATTMPEPLDCAHEREIAARARSPGLTFAPIGRQKLRGKAMHRPEPD